MPSSINPPHISPNTFFSWARSHVRPPASVTILPTNKIMKEVHFHMASILFVNMSICQWHLSLFLFQVSGYIDLGQRLKSPNKSDGLEAVFEGAKLLLPKPTDLSYYNWEVSTSGIFTFPTFLQFKISFETIIRLHQLYFANQHCKRFCITIQAISWI
jgi:hypothetical protein